MRKIAVLALVLISTAALAAVFTDTFDRANNATLGSDWTACGTNEHAIVSNAAASELSGQGSCDLYTGNSVGNDQYAAAVIQGKAAGSYFTVSVRGSGSGGTKNLYQCTIGGSNEYYITDIVNGANAGGEVSGTTTFADGDELECRASGTTIGLYVNNSLVNSATFTSHASGAPGIESYWGTAGTRPTFTTFEAGDLGGGGTSAVPKIMQQLEH